MRRSKALIAQTPPLTPRPNQVILVTDGIPDSAPGEMNDSMIYENIVMVKGRGELCCLCSFAAGVIMINNADKIDMG